MRSRKIYREVQTLCGSFSFLLFSSLCLLTKSLAISVISVSAIVSEEL